MPIAIIPAGTPVEELGELPAGVELMIVDPSSTYEDRARGAEFIVFGPELRGLLGQLHSFEALRVIQALNAGVDWLVPFVPGGATLCNASGVHDGPVAEWIVGVIIASLRDFPRLFAAQGRREWDTTGNALTTRPGDITGDDLQAKRVVVVGHGAIGHAVERCLQPFGAQVVGVTRRAKPGTHGADELGVLLRDADVVVVTVPLTSETHHLVGAELLASLKDGALIVNASRGPVINQDALERELRSGRLRAALDVTDPEPLPADHPLWTAPNIIITPHTAGSVRRWRARAHHLAGDQLRRYVAGEPLINVVLT